MSFVAVAYFFYAILVVPWIDGEVSQKKIETLQPTGNNNQRYEKLITDLFPEDDWIRGRCKILDAKQSILFFKEAKQLEDGNWEVKPFTMFLNPNEALVDQADGTPRAPEKPIILRTEAGAYIKFEDGSSPNSPNGKFSGARMPGKVVVIREESEPGAEDNFEFITKNIQVNKKQILAVNPVEFKYGSHYGNGHSLTINLADVSKNKRPGRRQPLVRNLKTIELAHLDKIMLLPSPSDMEASSGGELQSDLESKLEESPVKITCTGPFRLDFGKSEMVLFDQVHVEQLHEETAHDHLYCDRLQVHFRLKHKSGESADQESKEKLKFQSITAFGQPARLLVDSRNAYAQANQISYHIPRRIIHCQNEVLFRDGAHQFEAPEIQYKLTTNNQLGTGWATGPGKVIGHPDDDSKQFQATWQSELNLQPHEGKKVISLHGNSHIVFRGDQHFQCEELHFWIWEKRQRGPKPKWDFFPAQMLGLRSVRLNAPEFAGRVDEVRVFWPAPIGTIRPRRENRLTNTKSSKAKFASNRKQPASGQDRKTERQKKPVENRIVGTGYLATAYLTKDHELESFRVEGPESKTSNPRSSQPSVHVQSIDLTPLSIGKPSRLLLDVKGTDVQIDSTKKKDAFKVSVRGTPATIAADGIQFETEVLSVDQSTNTAWSNVPGTIQVSPEIQSDTRPLGPEPKTTIHWNKSLKFDGWVLRLTDKIRFSGLDYLKTGEQVTFEGETDQLAASTNQFVNFRKSIKLNPDSNSNSKSKIKISELALLNNAYLKATTRETINEVKSIDEIDAIEINVRLDTGDARAIGPGTVRSIRQGSRKDGKQPGGLIAGLASSKEKLSYIEVAFDGKIIGNFLERKGTVNENVRAVYGPANDWNVRYDPDGTSIFGEEIYINCNQMKFSQWQPVNQARPIVELAAIGNTEIEGKKFRALATQLTYTEENEIIQLEGLDRSNAKIWFRKNERQPWQYGEAKKFKYQKSTSEIVGSEDLKEMRFLQFEAPKKRRR